jgi:hypothetical protein
MALSTKTLDAWEREIRLSTYGRLDLEIMARNLIQEVRTLQGEIQVLHKFIKNSNRV